MRLRRCAARQRPGWRSRKAQCHRGKGRVVQLQEPTPNACRSHSWSYGFELFEMLAKFAASPKGADFNARSAPAGKSAYFRDGMLLEVQEGNDEAVVGGKQRKEAFHQFACSESVGWRFARIRGLEVFEPVAFSPLEQRQVAESPFRTAALGSQGIETGADGEACQPVLERFAVTGLVLIETDEHLEKHVLGEIFLGHAAGEMTADDADDFRIEMLDQRPRGVVIPGTYLVEARGDVEFSGRHLRIALVSKRQG
jgi:hypothetical protein